MTTKKGWISVDSFFLGGKAVIESVQSLIEAGNDFFLYYTDSILEVETEYDMYVVVDAVGNTSDEPSKVDAIMLPELAPLSVIFSVCDI